MARKFFFVCGGIFLLALAYHFGAQSAGAQVGSQVTGVAVGPCEELVVMTANGDVYYRVGSCGFSFSGPPTHAGNFWSGAGPTPAKQETWSRLKARYR